MTLNYICDMKKYPVLIQISFHSDESYMERYLLIVELVNGEAKIVHLLMSHSGWYIIQKNASPTQSIGIKKESWKESIVFGLKIGYT